jgi:hypothetical protein
LPLSGLPMRAGCLAFVKGLRGITDVHRPARHVPARSRCWR